MLQQVAEGGGRDDPQVDRDAVVGLGADAVGAGIAGGGDQRVGGEVLGERGGLLGGGDQVDVLAGLGPAPDRAGDLDLASRRGARAAPPPAPRRSASPSRAADGPVPPPARPPARARRGCSPPLSAPSPLTSRSFSVSAAAFRSSIEAISSSSKSRRAVFGPTPGTRVTSIRVGGNFAFSFTAAGISPVSSSASIFSASVLPTPGTSVALPWRGELGDRDGALADRLGGGAVGEDAVFDRAVELVENPQLFQRGGDLGVRHPPRNTIAGLVGSGANAVFRPWRGSGSVSDPAHRALISR